MLEGEREEHRDAEEGAAHGHEGVVEGVADEDVVAGLPVEGEVPAAGDEHQRHQGDVAADVGDAGPGVLGADGEAVVHDQRLVVRREGEGGDPEAPDGVGAAELVFVDGWDFAGLVVDPCDGSD